MNNVKKIQSKKKEAAHSIPSPILIFMGTCIVVTVGVCSIYFGFRNGPIFRTRMPVRSIDPIRMLQTAPDVQIVDIRSASEYKKGHIKNAISLPTYTINGKKMQFSDVSKLVIPKTISFTKPIVFYGPTANFTQTIESAEQFASNGFRTMTLSVGWNEFRHFQNMWIPESLWGAIDVNSYIVEN